MVDASAAVHAVAENQRKRFYGAVTYALWETWGPVEAPLPCPAGLIAGYQAEEDLHIEEFRPAAGPHSEVCAQVVTLSRVFARRLHLLGPAGDTAHYQRVSTVIASLADDLPEQVLRYGVGTGLAIRFLDHAAQQGLPRDQWLRPITAAQAMQDWTAGGEPFWVDIVKVGNVDESMSNVGLDSEGAYALRDGCERDLELTIFAAHDDSAVVALMQRVRTKRLSGKRAMDPLEVPPNSHLWALAQLGFTDVVVGDYAFEIKYMFEPETLEAIRAELADAALGKVVPRRND
jgi:hypothetical protein